MKLAVLTADLDMENTVRGVLQRGRSLGIASLVEGRDVSFMRHPNRDSGCFRSADVFLRRCCVDHDHALVFFDHDGSGVENMDAAEIEKIVEDRLSKNGWDDRARVVVIEPELESWVWNLSPNVELELGWKGRVPSLRDWLVHERLLKKGEVKPVDPKDAMERAMRESGTSRSAKIFYNLARKVSLSRCVDRAFLKFKDALLEWFPE